MHAQRVLVTAGASGIGREIAAAFAAAGARVFVLDLDGEALAALASATPGVQTSVCDLSKGADIELAVPAAIASLGGLDVLVNNAGISGPTAPVEAFDPAAWELVMQINLTGTFNVTRLAIPELKKSGAASIIIMSSVAGRYGYPNRCAYSTSKWVKTRFGWSARTVLSAAIASTTFTRIPFGTRSVKFLFRGIASPAMTARPSCVWTATICEPGV